MKYLIRYELKQLFGRIRTYVFLALMVSFGALFTTYLNFYNMLVNYEYTLETVSFGLLLFLPLITFDSFAGEMQSGYDQMLFSLGIKRKNYFFGKMTAVISVFAIHFVLLAINPIILSFFAKINVRATLAALLGYLLTGISLVTLLLFISAVSKSRLVSALVSYGAMAAVYLIGNFRDVIAASSGTSFIVLTVLVALTTVAVWKASQSGTFEIICAAVCEIPAVVTFFVSPKALQTFTYSLLGVLSPIATKSGFFYGILDLSSIITLIAYISVFVLLTLCLQEKRKKL